MTPDKNFRMSKQSKTLVTLLAKGDAHMRGHFKRMMVEAQLAEEAAKRASLKSKDSKKSYSTVVGNEAE